MSSARGDRPLHMDKVLQNKGHAVEWPDPMATRYGLSRALSGSHSVLRQNRLKRAKLLIQPFNPIQEITGHSHRVGSPSSVGII